MTITVRYYAIDGVRRSRRFKHLASARRYAQDLVGKTPEMGGMYAVSYDGIGTVRCEGASMRDLFPDAFPPPEWPAPRGWATVEGGTQE